MPLPNNWVLGNQFAAADMNTLETQVNSLSNGTATNVTQGNAVLPATTNRALQTLEVNSLYSFEVAATSSLEIVAMPPYTLDPDLTTIASIFNDGIAKRSGTWAAYPNLSKVDTVQPICIVIDGIGLPTTSTAATAGTTENVMTVGVAASMLQLEYLHYQGSDALPAGTITFNASINYAPASAGAVGTIFRVTFGGRTTATLDPGGKILSDPINLNVNVGDIIAARTFLASGTAYAPRVLVSGSAKGGFTTTTDLTAPGSTTIASSTGYQFGAAMLLGLPTPGSAARSVMMVGDSIGDGAGDGVFSTDAPQLLLQPWNAMGGFALRALVGHAGYVNAGLSSETAQNVAGTVGYHRLTTANRATSAIIQLGVNDLTGSRTAAQLEGDLLTIATVLRRAGIQKIFLTTITPVSTSTDAWATTGNQTTNAANTARVTHNNWVRGGSPIDPIALTTVTVGTSNALLAGQPGHPITGFFEVADQVESARDSGLWKAAIRATATGAITSGLPTLTASGGAFTSADLGRSVDVVGAGAAGALLNFAYISAVGSGTSVTLTANAGTTVSSAQTVIGGYSHDGTHPTPDGHLAISAAIDYTRL